MFSKNKAIRELLSISQELCDVAAASAVLAWDQETYMPPGGAKGRAYQLGTLSAVYHQLLTADRVTRALARAKRAATTNKFDLALIREIHREHRRATRLPNQLVRQISITASRAFESWHRAKQAGNFQLFAADLAQILRLKVAAARLLRDKKQTVYDVMLDEFEPQLTEAQVERTFSYLLPHLGQLATRLTPLANRADRVLKKRGYSSLALTDFSRRVAQDMGYAIHRGRLDTSAHPFTTTFSIDDVRITTWESDTDPRLPIFTVVHEAGHALYEQGVDPRLERTHLAGGIGLVMHESQSRLWENLVARSEAFWSTYYPRLQKEHPDQLGPVSLEQFLKAINVVRPSPIRTQADEVTYGLHVILRFEIERQLVSGRIKVSHLPRVWNRLSKRIVGIVPQDDRQGILQDVHWSHGAFGYFPTYLLGTAAAAQIWATAQKQVDVTNLTALRGWLGHNIHRHGKVYSTQELLTTLTGEPLNPRHHVDYLQDKFSKLYPEEK